MFGTFFEGGFGTFHSLLNSFIHFLMYTYYGLAAMGPAWQRFLWWKKYMTTFQIVSLLREFLSLFVLARAREKREKIMKCCQCSDVYQ